MSIYLYSGTPGSGKSLHAANDIRLALNRKNRPVLGNFELSQVAPVKSRDNYLYIPNEVLTPEKVTEYATEYWETGGRAFREDWIYLVIDEAQLIFNSREWNRDMQRRMAWLEFLSQHRKYGVKVILLAQDAKMIDNQFRMLIEYECHHRKLSNFGLVGRLVGTLFLGRLYLWIMTYYSMNEVLEREFYLASNKDFAMYDSYKRFERT